MSTILGRHTWCGPSANLECRSETSCTRLAHNTGRKNYQKNRHLRTVAQLCQASFATIGKKILLNSNISSACPHNMVNFGLLTAKIGWRVWGTPANFSGFCFVASYCSDVAQRRSTKLCTMFGCLLGGTPRIHFWGLLPLTEFCQVQNSLCVQVLRLHTGSVTAWHLSSERQPNFAA